MKERILFVGIGQGGSNIVNLFKGENYLTFFLNTSGEDLQLIDSEFKYHIPGGRGCNKDREKALEFAKGYYEQITNTIENNFPSQDIVYLVFTLGGGTGSGLGPILLDILANENPNKKYNAIVVLPSFEESLQARINAIEGYKELANTEGLNSLFILDNNKMEDKLQINEEFFKLFESIINITTPDKRGIIDKAELELLLTTKGATLIAKPGIKTIFADYEKGCRYIGLSTNDKDKGTNLKELEEMFGKPIDTFMGYNNKETMFVISGMEIPVRTIYETIATVREDREKITKTRGPLTFNVPSINIIEDKEKEEKKDISDIFKKYTR